MVFNVRQFIFDSWNGIMNANVNPLKNITDMQVRHLVLQTLAWMWCITFSIMIGDLFFFGYTLVAHTVLIVAVVITVSTFETARRSPTSFNFVKKYHTPSRSRHQWYNGKRITYPDGDPGGEHE